MAKCAEKEQAEERKVEHRVEYRVENIVISSSLGYNLDLRDLADNLPGATYNPVKFPGVVIPINEPKVLALIFSSGKIVCSGAKSIEEAEEGLAQIIDKINQIKGEKPFGGQ